MSKHTPGPWEDGNTSDSIIVKSIPEGHLLGPSNASDRNIYGGYVIAESVAPQNKPIIKAAPAMLEALESFPGWNASPGLKASWIVQMDAAIMKAKGE